MKGWRGKREKAFGVHWSAEESGGVRRYPLRQENVSYGATPRRTPGRGGQCHGLDGYMREAIKFPGRHATMHYVQAFIIQCYTFPP